MASGARGEDTSGCGEAWGHWQPLEPHPEAGTSESCLPRLATRGVGASPRAHHGWRRQGRPHGSAQGRGTAAAGRRGDRRTRPPPAPRKALAARVACGGVAGRRGLAEEGRGAQQGAEPLPHANMVSCNHCRGERDGSAGDGRNAESSLPAQKPPSLHPLRAGGRGPSGGRRALSYLLYPWETRVLAPTETSGSLALPSGSLPSTQMTPPHPPRTQEALRTWGWF